MKARSGVAISFAIMSSLFLAACGGPVESSADTAEFVKDGTLALSINEDPGDLNPVLTNKAAAQIVGLFAYDSLIFTDPESGDVKPYLASSWTESPNKVTFTLQRGITCSDGSPFTAQTAADNFNWITDPKNGSPLNGSMIPAAAKATVVGDVLTVETPEASPFLLRLIGNSALACGTALEDPKSVSAASAGTGLFTIKEVVPNDHITLERRAGYKWGPEGKTTSDTLGVPKTVTIKVVPNPSTAANLLISKGINVAGIAAEDEARVQAANLAFKSSTSLAGQLNFNHFDGLPTSAPEIRKALVAAVDLDTYTKIVTGGTGKRATSLAAGEPSVCVYDSVEGALPSFDPKNAEALLTEAGWSKNSDGVMEKDGKPLSIPFFYLNTADRFSAAAEYVAAQWTALGAKVTLHGGDANYLITNTFSAADPSSWGASTMTIQSRTPSIFPAYLMGKTPPEGTNFMSINNEQYKKEVAKARLATGDAACDLWKGTEQTLFREADVIPVSVGLAQTYFNGATTIYNTGTLLVPGSAYRVTR